MAVATTLCLVRHAAAECTKNGAPLLCGHFDASLSPLGQDQVNRLRRRLATETPFQALYTSHLRRARETAQGAPEQLLASLRIETRLAEINCGVLDGLPIEQVQRNHPDLWQKNQAQDDDEFSWPGGESYRSFRRRVVTAIEEIAHRYSGQRVLIVTHAGVINQILGSLAGQSAAMWENFRPRNASITRVFWSGPLGGEIDVFDDCSHL